MGGRSDLIGLDLHKALGSFHCEMIHQVGLRRSTCGLVAMISASHTEGCQLDPGQAYYRSLKQLELI
jgi:hypothetical protein